MSYFWTISHRIWRVDTINAQGEGIQESSFKLNTKNGPKIVILPVLLNLVNPVCASQCIVINVIDEGILETEVLTGHPAHSQEC